MSVIVVVAVSWHPRVANADGIMLVSAGAFWMGSDDGASNERPLHRVFVRDFWIERHKVTNAEFAAFLNATELQPPGTEHRFDDDDPDARIHLRNGRWIPDPGFEHHPAVEVSWFGARDFCWWRGRRLPTEAEWEKAARGEDKRRYPWGAESPSPELAVFGRAYNATDRGDLRPRGANPYGVEDLLGNTREWTSSVLRPYPYRDDEPDGGAVKTTAAEPERRADAPARRADTPARRADAPERRADTPDPFANGQRVVVRGASHDDPGDSLSITMRRSYERRGASAGHHFVGFRCATSEDLGEISR